MELFRIALSKSILTLLFCNLTNGNFIMYMGYLFHQIYVQAHHEADAWHVAPLWYSSISWTCEKRSDLAWIVCIHLCSKEKAITIQGAAFTLEVKDCHVWKDRRCLISFETRSWWIPLIFFLKNQILKCQAYRFLIALSLLFLVGCI